MPWGRRYTLPQDVLRSSVGLSLSESPVDEDGATVGHIDVLGRRMAEGKLEEFDGHGIHVKGGSPLCVEKCLHGSKRSRQTFLDTCYNPCSVGLRTPSGGVGVEKCAEQSDSVR